MTYSPHPDAELEEAIEFYESCETGLGYDFFIEVRETIERIMAHPDAWPVLDVGMRRCLTSRIPFALIYAVREEGIFILAVMHLRRKPDSWKHRR